jgi:hypothetical protein
MVGWSDFLSASPAAQEWHFALGVAVGLLVVVLFRYSPVWGGVLLGAFIAFVLAKEFWIATYIENESFNEEGVSMTFWFTGAVLGAGAALLPPKAGVVAAVAGLSIVLSLLAFGVI